MVANFLFVKNYQKKLNFPVRKDMVAAKSTRARLPGVFRQQQDIASLLKKNKSSIKPVSNISLITLIQEDL